MTSTAALGAPGVFSRSCTRVARCEKCGNGQNELVLQRRARLSHRSCPYQYKHRTVELPITARVGTDKNESAKAKKSKIETQSVMWFFA